MVNGSSTGISSLTRTIGLFSSLCGLLLSTYSIYVSKTKRAYGAYEAYCDISSSISCSKVFTSEYGYGFGIMHHIFGRDSFLNCSNSIFGTIFYALQMMGFLRETRLVNLVMFWTSALSLVMCVYLAYILAFILHDFCLVCVSTYIINPILFILNVVHIRRAGSYSKKKSKRKED